MEPVGHHLVLRRAPCRSCWQRPVQAKSFRGVYQISLLHRMLYCAGLRHGFTILSCVQHVAQDIRRNPKARSQTGLVLTRPLAVTSAHGKFAVRAARIKDLYSEFPTDKALLCQGILDQKLASDESRLLEPLGSETMLLPERRMDIDLTAYSSVLSTPGPICYPNAPLDFQVPFASHRILLS